MSRASVRVQLQVGQFVALLKGSKRSGKVGLIEVMCDDLSRGRKRTRLSIRPLIKLDMLPSYLVSTYYYYFYAHSIVMSSLIMFEMLPSS